MTFNMVTTIDLTIGTEALIPGSKRNFDTQLHLPKTSFVSPQNHMETVENNSLYQKRYF